MAGGERFFEHLACSNIYDDMHKL